ncbi:hypothetical protein [Armatimonas sp.]|uniref:hypothetical protein n=1 Tax=Armatimonas sp. TaxID=1872638 RepID=UPI0037514AB6
MDSSSYSVRRISVPLWLRNGSWRFPLGTVNITEAAQALLRASGRSIENVLSRHASGGFSDERCEDELRSNEENILKGSYVTSTFQVSPRLLRDTSAQPLEARTIWITTLIREEWTLIQTGDELAGSF